MTNIQFSLYFITLANAWNADGSCDGNADCNGGQFNYDCCWVGSCTGSSLCKTGAIAVWWIILFVSLSCIIVLCCAIGVCMVYKKM